MSNKNAVNVNNVYYGYRGRVKVIKNLSVTVEKGKIFALLGENGCGKTTLLKMILGQMKPEFGTIDVFGHNPLSQHSDIPGPGVGYMPQELALFNELTIEEMLFYFATIFHLKSDEIKDKINHLIRLLNLPEKSRRIDKLSGGQKRLVSLAVSIIHNPKLIILDEPSVGVDPLLRSRIWSYLEDLCHRNGNTVIITTHYIEEAKRASNVGFMKSGALLKQSNPQKLMSEYQCSTLEGVYLYLWERKDRMIIERKRSTIADIEADLPTVSLHHQRRQSQIKYSKRKIDFKRIFALIWKFYVRTKRFPLFLILFNFIPIIALTSMHTTLGSLPYKIPVSVFSGESHPKHSKLFVDIVDKKYLDTSTSPSKEAAIESVIRGKSVFAITFEDNFTQNLESRLQRPFDMNDNELSASTIKLYADFSESVTGLYVIHYLGETFLQFVKNVSRTLNLNPLFFSLPFTIEDPVYGTHFITNNQMDKLKTFSELLTPAALIAILHLISMAYSAFLIVYDRKGSHLDRYFVAGGQPIEVLIALYVQYLVIVSVQVFLTLLFAFGLFGERQVGSYIEVYAICVMQSLQGMSIGLFVSLLFYDEISVAIGLSALMFPVWIMSGVFWPLEAIPAYFRIFADWTPLSKPIEALRQIMSRGWTYQNTVVWMGYAVSLSYTTLLTISSVVLFQIFSFNSLSFNHFLF